MKFIYPAPLGRRLTILSCVAVMSFPGGGAAARSPISLDVLQRKGYGSVELIKGGENKLYVPTEINGQKIRLLLDTGVGSEGITVGINPAALHVVPDKGVQMTLTVSGARVPVGHGTAESVVMGNVHIQGTPIYFGRFVEMGFVGRGFLQRNSAIIDLTNLRLYLRPPGKGRRVDLGPALTSLGLAMAPFFDAAHGSFVLNVEVNGFPTQMVLDTGAQLTLLDPRFAKAASTKGWDRRDFFGIDAAGVKSASDFAGTKTFKIQGIPIRTPIVALGKFSGYDATGGKVAGLLGLDVIGMNWGIIDVAQKRFYFTRAN